MRRLPRLRGPASAALSSSSTTSSCLRTPITATYSSSASSTATQHISRTARWQSTLQRRCLSTSVPRCDKQPQEQTTAPTTTTTTPATEEAPAAIVAAEETKSTEVVEQEEAEYNPDELIESTAASEELELAEEEIETDLIYPRETVEAPIPAEITDADYVPAESGAGLEQVGGLQDWWERPGHWGESKKYVGFGPTQKVNDFAVLEVLTRRAVVEALAIRAHALKGASKEDVDAALGAVVGEQEVMGIEEVELVPGENDVVAIKEEEDVNAVWEELVARKETAESAPETPTIDREGAKEMIKVWGSQWKKGTVHDPILKFYIAKRLQRLTGHIIADTKLHGASITVGGIIAAMARKPKPKKLAELLQKTGILADLPNVHVYPRRVTPIDKEQMVGRWKLIQKELEARELPVTGHDAKHSKTAEWKWARGQS